jgi:hypothetical protein
MNVMEVEKYLRKYVTIVMEKKEKPLKKNSK